MKYLMFLAGLALVGTASAAELCTVDGPSHQTTPPGLRAPVTITQNFNTTTINSTQVACGNNAFVYTTENWFLRRFRLFEDHELADGITVSSVDWSVSMFDSDTSPPPAYRVDVVLLQIGRGAAFLFANMTELARVSVPITTADIGTFKRTLISGGVIDGVSTDLVVAAGEA